MKTRRRQGVIAHWRDLVRHYVGLGICGFRCDAAYQVPVEVWAPLMGRRAKAAANGCSPPNADPHERHEATVRDVDVDLATAVEITPGRQGARLGRANRVAVNRGEIGVFAGST